MKRHIIIHVLAFATILMLSVSAYGGGGSTLDDFTAGYTAVYNTANRQSTDITIDLKALITYYPYDTDTTITFKNGIAAPVTAITVLTTDDTEIWSIEGTDLFKNSQTDGTTSAATQSAFFIGRSDSTKGPLFAGVKNEIMAAAAKQGISLSGFSSDEAETGVITLNTRTMNETAIGIKIAYTIQSSGADPSSAVNDITDSPSYAEATKVKFTVSDTHKIFSSFTVGGEENDATTDLVFDRELQTCSTALTGTLSGAEGTLSLTATLVDDDGNVVTANNAVVKKTAEIYFYADTGSDTGSQVDAGTVNLNVSNLAGTAADPGSENWNGVDLNADTAGPGTADKAKILNISATNFTGGTFEEQKTVITISGAAPNAWVYIAQKDAKTLFPGDDGEYPEENIYLTKSEIASYGIPFRVLSFDQGADVKGASSTLTLAFSGISTALKTFPITVAVQNSAMSSPVTKTFKLNVNASGGLQWNMVSFDEYNDQIPEAAPKAVEIAVPLSDTTDVAEGSIYPVFTVSGEGYYRITVKPLEKNGIEATVTQPVIDRFGGVSTPGSVAFSGSLENDTKESKTAFTITAANTSTKKKASLKVSVAGKLGASIKDKIETDEDTGVLRINPAKTKRTEAGKVPSISLKAAGSKTIVWKLGDDNGITDDDTVNNGEYYAAVLADVGLSFDRKTGKFKALTSAKDILPTVNLDGDFESLDVVVHATNGYGDGDFAKVWVAVTGAKPSLNTTKLTLSRDAFESGDIAGILSVKLGKTVLTSADSQGNRVRFSPLNKKGNDEDTEALADLGLELLNYDDFNGTEYYNYGVLRVIEGGLKATKGKKIALRLENLGAVSTGNLTLTINDPVPVIETDCASDDDGIPTAALSASKTAADTATVNLWISDETAPTLSGTKFTWKVQAPKKSSVKATVKADSATKGQKAVLTLTLPKNKLTAEEGDFVIQAANSVNRKTGKITIHVAANQTASTSADVDSAVITILQNDGALPESGRYHDGGNTSDSESYAESESENSVTENSVILGGARNLESLSAEQRAFIESKGYTVVAVLPETEATSDGQQDIDAELFEDAPKGAVLVWMAFPQNAEASEDDKIADFYDGEGNPIKEVPEGRKLKVSPWLRRGVIYEPVICAEAK